MLLFFLKGCIDSKTTKRMLLTLEKENKLRTFIVYLKNISYMGVRHYDVEEKDTLFINYCSTFKRTFDTVELKVTNNRGVSEDDSLDVNSSPLYLNSFILPLKCSLI